MNARQATAVVTALARYESGDPEKAVRPLLLHQADGLGIEHVATYTTDELAEKLAQAIHGRSADRRARRPDNIATTRVDSAFERKSAALAARDSGAVSSRTRGASARVPLATAAVIADAADATAAALGDSKRE